MTKIHKIAYASTFIAILALAWIAFNFNMVSAPAFGNANSGGPQVFFSVATSTSETVTSNVMILATSTGRTWARIANTSGVAVTCIYDNGMAATVNNGFIIAASSTFEMNQLSEPIYTGSVNCISDGASAKLYIEANQ